MNPKQKYSRYSRAEKTRATSRVTQMQAEIRKLESWPGITATALRSAYDQLNAAVAAREAMDEK